VLLFLLFLPLFSFCTSSFEFGVSSVYCYYYVILAKH
jgi:hypothetical protein